MNKVRLHLLFVALMAACNFATAQIYLKIEAIPGTTNTWGVYTRVCDNVMPSGNTITGSGQITVKFPSGLSFSNLTSVAGNWAQNSVVQNPTEAPGKIYVSMGFQQDNPHIIYQPDTETLLFTFNLTGTVAGNPELIVNGVDPFDILPNSASSNPGNELTVIDFGVQPLGLYTYVGNYVGNNIGCGSNPQDTTVVTPPGDTTTQDTTIITPPGDTTTQDTTIITPPGDTTSYPGTHSGDDSKRPTLNPNEDNQQTSGVKSPSERKDIFMLYPTPAYEWVTVKFLNPTPEGGTIRLFTLNGISIGEIKRGQRQELTLNVGGLSSGLYIIKYDKDGKTLQQDKFLKQ
jgi:hypothetical protein